jgi:uncharacterized protein
MPPYHPGERAVQRRAAVTEQAAHSARAIRREIPDTAARFLTEQGMLVIGAAAPDGRLWCSVLTGAPGFVQAPDPRTVLVGALPHPDDPLAPTVAAGPAPLGTLALQPRRRRRMRLNGISRPQEGSLAVTVEQVYANCPKYIQRRELHPPPVAPHGAARRWSGSALTPAQQRLVTEADTFFVATADAAGNADASHRGGMPGFVAVHGPTRLSWPDYVGNAMFMTLGNLEDNPRAGLLFLDFSQGTVLQLSGAAQVAWDPARIVGTPGAQRVVDFEIDSVVQTSGRGPVSQGPVEYSPANPASLSASGS